MKFKEGDRVRIVGLVDGDASRPVEWPWFNGNSGVILERRNETGYIGNAKTSAPSYLVRFDEFDYRGNPWNGHTAGAAILEWESPPSPDELAETIRSIKEAL